MKQRIARLILPVGLFFLLGMASLLVFPLSPPKMPIIHDLTSNDLWFASSPPRPSPKLLSFDSLPPAMLNAMEGSIITYTELTSLTRTRAASLPSLTPAVQDVWCVTIYPQATLRLMAEPRLITRPYGNPTTASADVTERSVDHFFVLKRGAIWELYAPEVFHWNALGCHS